VGNDSNIVYYIIIVMSSLASGLLGVIISTFYYRRYEKRKIKLDAARRILGSRHDILGGEFTQALNEAFVVFHDSPRVTQALGEFHVVINLKHSKIANEKLVCLFKAVCDEVGISYDTFNDSYFLQPFNPNPKTVAKPIAPGDATIASPLS
jgi:hypothetical protein